jgi:four helix bundle protein
VAEVSNQKPETRKQKVDRVKPVQSFEDLEVFQRAYRLSLEIHRVSLSFPAREQYGLADQLRRASKSIPANLAEGFAKQRSSAAEFKRFLGMAVGSADEMRVWIRYALDLGYVEQSTWQRWRDEYQEIAKMLHGLSRRWVARRGSGK